MSSRSSKSVLIHYNDRRFKGIVSLNSLYVDLVHSTLVKLIQNYIVLRDQPDAVIRVGTDGLNNYLVISKLHNLQTVPTNCSFRVDKNGVSELQFKISVISRDKTKLNLRESETFDVAYIEQLKTLSDSMKRPIYVGNFAELQTFPMVGIQIIKQFVADFDEGAAKVKISVRDYRSRKQVFEEEEDKQEEDESLDS